MPVAVEVARERFANGVELLVVPVPSAPVVTLTVVEGAGTSSDPAGRSGWTNLAARGGVAATAERRAMLVRERGGRSSLLVGPDDVIATYELPPGELELALWLEADRLSAAPTEEALLAALRSIAEERVARPFERHRDRLDALVFQGFAPYAHAPDGTADELLAIREDLLSGALPPHPARAIAVVVAGPITAADVAPLVRRHLAGVQAGASPRPRGLPEQINQRAATATDAEAAAPAIAMAFAVSPEAVRADGDALDVAGALLSLPEGPRTELTALGDGAVERVNAWLERREGPSVFRVEAHLTSTADPVLVRERLERQLGDLGKSPPRATDVTRATLALSLAEAAALDRPGSLNEKLARAALRGAPVGSWDLGRWRAVQAEQVMHAVAEHLSPIRRNVLEIAPEHPVAPPVAPPPPPPRGGASAGPTMPRNGGGGKGTKKAEAGKKASPKTKPRGRGAASPSRPDGKPAKKRGGK